MCKNINKESDKAASSAVETIVMFFTNHAGKFIIALVILVASLLYYASNIESKEIHSFLSTSLIEMEIGHLLVVLVLWMLFKD